MIPFSPSMFVYKCNMELRTYVLLRWITLISSAIYWRKIYAFTHKRCNALDNRLPESLSCQVCPMVEVVSGRTLKSNSQLSTLGHPCHTLFPNSLSASQLIRDGRRGTASLSHVFLANQNSNGRVYIRRVLFDWVRGSRSAGQWPNAVMRSLCLLPSAWLSRKSETPLSNLSKRYNTHTPADTRTHTRTHSIVDSLQQTHTSSQVSAQIYTNAQSSTHR